MSRGSSTTTAQAGDDIRFEIRDGVRRISCSVSNEALEAASCLSVGAAPALRRQSFDRFRTLIHAAATLRISAMAPGTAGPIVLTEADLRQISPERGSPVFGIAPRAAARPTEG